MQIIRVMNLIERVNEMYLKHLTQSWYVLSAVISDLTDLTRRWHLYPQGLCGRKKCQEIEHRDPMYTKCIHPLHLECCSLRATPGENENITTQILSYFAA